MHSSTLISLLALAPAVLGAAVSGRPNMTPRHRDQGVPLNLLAKRAACGEGAQRVCYTQNIDPEDIEYAALYLRHIAETNNDPIWNMPSEFDCSEWTIPIFGAGSVLALAKHINPRTNSGVTYTDLARTIDGGEDATDAQRAASLLGGCGGNGGQLGVIIDPANPAYKTPEYIAAKMKPADIIVKLVRDPSFGG
ncbi:hypothetical protein QBC40DRAFT_275270 [Triangularia verruculosa]|uniref:Ecp2 effector protein domain-containing protein n=1 Tax=Triangularia verruculosa TaxID=2587418 RepID=A0AAN7AZK9_9PEZI|nr:hypothetical protein QBC40DRAFT_275270 [Triangularia verruculosa]